MKTNTTLNFKGYFYVVAVLLIMSCGTDQKTETLNGV